MSKRLEVEDVLQAIRGLTENLKTIREEISAAVMQESSLEGSIFLESGNSAETISRFRAAIDDLRHTLWLYVETTQTRKENDPERQRKLLARATEILCALSTHPPLPQTCADPMEGSFVERLLHFMEVWIQPPMQQPMESKPQATHAVNGHS